MQRFIGTALGKTVRLFTKLRGSGGQALPGLVVERAFPHYLQRMLAQLPDGIVVITGTNGKTTTTKMVVELLQANGKRVLTNPTGSNFTRGITSGVAGSASITGHLAFDIGVFELDEAYARQFVAKIKPRWVLGLNVMRDQLDRFGELDTAAKMIGSTMQAATVGLVTNADDVRLRTLAQAIAKDHKLQLHYFGVVPQLRKFFPADDELVAVGNTPAAKPAGPTPLVALAGWDEHAVSFKLHGNDFRTPLLLSGHHNYQNAAAAAALAHSLLPNVPPSNLIEQLGQVAPAFGRGEKFTLKNGSTLQLLLVKNPAGFRQTLASYNTRQLPVMFAVNDNYADGRDVSWLWDVDFTAMAGVTVPMTTGSRGADMALRLQYDDVPVARVESNLDTALTDFCQQPGDKLLITTYTAMLRFHKLLKRHAGTKL